MSLVLHGLIQKAKIQAEDLHTRLRAGSSGDVWEMRQYGWVKTGQLIDPQNREDFLVSQLTQEDR